MSEFGFGRNRPDAVRLGIRTTGGKPQPRWHEGVSLAKALHEVRSESLIGSATLSIGTRFRQAQSFLRQLFDAPG